MKGLSQVVTNAVKVMLLVIGAVDVDHLSLCEFAVTVFDVGLLVVEMAVFVVIVLAVLYSLFAFDVSLLEFVVSVHVSDQECALHATDSVLELGIY